MIKYHCAFTEPSNAEIEQSKHYMVLDKWETGEPTKIYYRPTPIQSSNKLHKTLKPINRNHNQEKALIQAHYIGMIKSFTELLSQTKMWTIANIDYVSEVDRWCQEFGSCLIKLNHINDPKVTDSKGNLLMSNNCQLMPNYQQIDDLYQLLNRIIITGQVRIEFKTFMNHIEPNLLRYQPYWQSIYDQYHEDLPHRPDQSSPAM